MRARFRQPLPKKDGPLQVKAAVCFAPYVWIFSCGPTVPRRFDSISSACRRVIYAQDLPQGRGGWDWGVGEVGCRSVSGSPSDQERPQSAPPDVATGDVQSPACCHGRNKIYNKQIHKAVIFSK